MIWIELLQGGIDSKIFVCLLFQITNYKEINKHKKYEGGIPMSQINKPYDWSLPIVWVLLCTASMYFAGFLNFYSFNFINWLMTICFFATAQTLILNNLVDRPWRWLVVSVFGWFIAYWCQVGLGFTGLPDAFYMLSIGISSGLFIGVLQSLLLSSKLSNRIMWTVATFIGWSLPFGYLAAAESGLLGSGAQDWVSMGLYDTPLVLVIIKSFVGLSVGLITGIVLAYLLYQKRKADKSLEPLQSTENS